MARKKETEQTEPLEAQEQEQTLPQPPAVVAIKQIPDGFQLPPDGRLVPVKCTVEGYEHITVHFKVNNPWRFIHEADAIPNEDGWRVARQGMLIARRFEGWNFVDEVTLEPIAPPVAGDLDSYKQLFRNNSDFLALGIWCIGDGYKAALEASMGN